MKFLSSLTPQPVIIACLPAGLDFQGAKKTWQIGPFDKMTALRFFNTERILSDNPVKDKNWIGGYCE